MGDKRLRVLVCGGRDFSDSSTLTNVLDAVNEQHGIGVIIHGNARGADRLAGSWANMVGVGEDVYDADWNQYGRNAGPMRNALMLEKGKPDLVVAFPGGRGTADMVAKAEAAGVRVQRFGG